MSRPALSFLFGSLVLQARQAIVLEARSMPVFEKRTHINAPAARVFAFHEQPDAFERLVPPGDHATVVEKTGGIQVGARVVVDTRVGPFTRRIFKALAWTGAARP